MSWQAPLLRAYLRWTIKRGLKPDRGVGWVRAKMDRDIRILPPPPPEVRILPTRTGGVPGEWIETGPALETPAVLYLHGGGYVCGSPRTHRPITWRLARAAGARLLVPDYRLAPEHPCPAAVEDAVATWKGLIEAGVPAEGLTIAGDSAGGGLALAAMQAIRDAGLPGPACAVLFSPWTDLTGSGESMRRNAAADPMLSPHFAAEAARLYAPRGRLDAAPCSPLFGAMEDLPPTLVLAGTTEILLDDSRRLADRLREAGVDVTLDLWPNMPHAWPYFGDVLPEARTALAEAGRFIRRHTAR
ncbi:MAG: alpha/beta hydrolase [Alphaproteobacteria bacterium]|nr:alpha/beta hydrolase [Alphaproteobacteria bacterium]MDX5369250.1 alpha/beta hydrolase [Alphaproteobacteria bacterium]MDX5463939.1 alpha/beta hydrolase [Alphaproteobacteria bacterium]